MLDGKSQRAAIRTAVFRKEANAVMERVRRILDIDLPVLDIHIARQALFHACQRPHNLAAAGTYQAHEAQNLTPVAA